MMAEVFEGFKVCAFDEDDATLMPGRLVRAAASAPMVSVTMPAATAIRVAGMLRAKPAVAEPVVLDWVDRAGPQIMRDVVLGAVYGFAGGSVAVLGVIALAAVVRVFG